MIITDEQIRQLALYIVYDVRQYIQEHQKQYELFLESEYKSIQDSNNSSIMKGDCIDENEFTSSSRDSELNIKGTC